MKIKEERLPPRLLAIPTVEIGEDRVGEFTGFRGIPAAPEKRARRCAQVPPISFHEILPGRFNAFRASASQREVFKMQRREIIFDLLGSRRAPAKPLPSAPRKRFRKRGKRQVPAGSLRHGVQRLDQGLPPREQPR